MSNQKLFCRGRVRAITPKAVATTKKMTAPELMTLVRDAAAVFEQRGEEAFPEFREKGSRWFRDETYFFVWTLDGIRVFLAREYIDAAMKQGSAWVDYYWYKPGRNTPAAKHTYVRKVHSSDGTYIVGSGFYPPDKVIGDRSPAAGAETGKKGTTLIQKYSWGAVERQKIADRLSLQKIFGEKGTLARYSARRGDAAARHSHPSEEYMCVTSGALKYVFDDREVVVNVGEVLVVPPFRAKNLFTP